MIAQSPTVLFCSCYYCVCCCIWFAGLKDGHAAAMGCCQFCDDSAAVTRSWFAISKVWCLQSELVASADVAAAWQTYPESAPFHNLSVHVPRTARAEARSQVTIALVQRLGGHLSSARGCDVCVLCKSGSALTGTASNVKRKRRGAVGSSKAADVGPKPRCKAGAVFVTDAWVAEAVQKASRPEYDGFTV